MAWLCVQYGDSDPWLSGSSKVMPVATAHGLDMQSCPGACLWGALWLLQIDHTLQSSMAWLASPRVLVLQFCMCFGCLQPQAMC